MSIRAVIGNPGTFPELLPTSDQCSTAGLRRNHDDPVYKGLVMDESSHKPPSTVGFWMAMGVVVREIAAVASFGLPLAARIPGTGPGEAL
jgi:hypothetical protein